MNQFEHFRYPLLESCWDGYIPGGEHLFNQVSSEKQAKERIMKNIEELIEEMNNDYISTEKDINQSNSFEYIMHTIKAFRERWREKIKPYSPLYLQNIKSGRKLDYDYRLHNNLCDKEALLKQAMTNF